MLTQQSECVREQDAPDPERALLAPPPSPPPSPAREWAPSNIFGGGGGEGGSSGRATGIFGSVGAKMTNAIAPARDTVGAVVPGVGSNDSVCPSLTWKQRLHGCIGCFVVGMMLSLLGFISWWLGRTAQFGVFYTLGNVTSVCSSLFLIGPKRQFKNMTKAGRRIASGLYLGMMIITLAVALNDGPKPLVLICICAQWCALIWYVASYIPFGQKMITKFLGGVASF